MYDILAREERKDLDYQTALDYCPTMLTQEFALDELHADEEQLIFNDKPLKATYDGWTALFKVLRIPPKYGFKVCPRDLLRASINRLIQEDKKTYCLVKRPTDDVLIGITKKAKSVVKNKDILEGIPHPNRDSVKVNFSDAYMDFLSLIDEGVEARPGDVHKLGYYINGFEDGRLPVGGVGLYRMVCLNALYEWLPESIFKFVRSQGLGLFVSQIFDDKREQRIEYLQKTVRAVGESPVYIHQFTKSWRTISKILGKIGADEVLGVSEEERDLYTSQYRAWKKDGDPNEPIPLEIPIYDFLNSVTEIEKTLLPRDRTAVRKLGGELFQEMAELVSVGVSK